MLESSGDRGGLLQRPLLVSDRQELKRLHEEWFPVRYTELFYDDIVRNVIGKDKAPTWSAVAYDPGTSAESPPPPLAPITAPRAAVEDSAASFDASTPLPPGRMVGCVICQVLDESCCVDAGLLEDRGPRPQRGKRRRAEAHAARVDPNGPAGSEEVDLEGGGCAEEHESSAGAGADESGDEDPEAERPLEDQVMYVLTLGTDARYRRSGVAAALLASAEAHARVHRRCRAVYLHVITSNAAALNFYHKHGYAFLRRIPDYYLIASRHHACFLYIKYLDGPPPPFRPGGGGRHDDCEDDDDSVGGLALALSNGSAAVASAVSAVALGAVYPAVLLWRRFRRLFGTSTSPTEADAPLVAEAPAVPGEDRA